MLFAGWEVRIVKNCDRGLENAARGRGPWAAFSSPRSQFFTIRTDRKPANNLFTFFLRRIGLQLGLHNFVIELVYVPSTKHRKKSNELTNERVTQTLHKERCIKEQIYFELLYVSSI